MSLPPIDIKFEDAPLMLALVHVSFTQSPEVIADIATVKTGLRSIDLVVAEQRQQTSISVTQQGSPHLSQNNFWWFSSLERNRAAALAQNSFVLYDANYGGSADFAHRIGFVCDLIRNVAGEGCFLQQVALRYVSGFKSNGTPSPLLVPSMHGLPIDGLETDHFHNNFNFWCTTSQGGRLELNCKSVHGNQIIPQDVRNAGIQIPDKFSLSREDDAIQLDVHETLREKTFAQLSKERVIEITGNMRLNLKRAFLSATTQEAREQWK